LESKKCSVFYIRRILYFLKSHVLYVLLTALLFSWILLFNIYLASSNPSSETKGAFPVLDVKEENKGDEIWFKIYMDDKKIGYKREQIIGFESGFLVKEQVFLRLKALNSEQDVVIKSRYVTDKDFIIKAFRVNIISGVVQVVATGTVEGNELIFTLGEGSGKKTKRIALTSPLHSEATGFSHLLGIGAGKNAETELRFFNLLGLTADVIKVRYEGKEHLKINEKSYDSLKFTLEYGNLRSQVWVDQAGRVIKEEGMMGLRMERSDMEHAIKNLTVSEDLVFKNAIVPKGKRISQPERITSMKIRGEVKGLPLDNRQKKFGRDILITQETLPVYFRPEDIILSDLKDYLTPGTGIESDHPKIIELAQKIKGKEENLVNVVRRAVNYVHSKLEKRPVLSIASAIETLNLMAGDCKGHAVLLTAILRACGIPSKVVVGITLQDGMFYYHAWTEAYLGGWVSMDATLNQFPCDATHIKLLELSSLLGQEARQLSRIVGDYLGNLSLEILDFTYD